jgi:hypothetical protein
MMTRAGGSRTATRNTGAPAPKVPVATSSARTAPEHTVHSHMGGTEHRWAGTRPKARDAIPSRIRRELE